MTTIFSIADTNMDDSPPSLAYLTISLLSALFDFQIVAQDGIVMIADESGTVLAALETGSPVMAELYVSVLTRAEEELTGQLEGDENNWMASLN